MRAGSSASKLIAMLLLEHIRYMFSVSSDDDNDSLKLPAATHQQHIQ